MTIIPHRRSSKAVHSIDSQEGMSGKGIAALPYRDRAEGGRVLAAHLAEYANRDDVIVLGLPRGGVPVAYQLAHSLTAPLDVFVVRKLGVPGQEELAMGAIASGEVCVLNRELIRDLHISDSAVKATLSLETKELKRREHLYRGRRPPLQVAGKVVILVDDGMATGSTMLAAVRALRRQGPTKLIIGVPVAAEQTCSEFEKEVDEVVCAATPYPFFAVAEWYVDFSPTSDDEVRELLQKTI